MDDNPQIWKLNQTFLHLVAKFQTYKNKCILNSSSMYGLVCGMLKDFLDLGWTQNSQNSMDEWYMSVSFSCAFVP